MVMGGVAFICNVEVVVVMGGKSEQHTLTLRSHHGGATMAKQTFHTLPPLSSIPPSL